jgi:hypothetical protein
VGFYESIKLEIANFEFRIPNCGLRIGDLGGHRAWSIEHREIQLAGGSQQRPEKKDSGRRRAFCQLSVVRGPLSVAAIIEGKGKRAIFFYSMLYAPCPKLTS